MFDAPRARVALLTLVVVLAVVQPAPAGARADASPAADAGGDVGTTIGSAVERHPAGAGATAEALRTVRADAVHDRG
ncbi:hypothetical protein ACFR97_14440, partial [Haloplanus litoreus]